MTVARTAPAIWGSRQFFDDVRKLPQHIVKKLRNVVTEIESFGPRHPPLRTRRIQRNADGRFHFINVDEQYRIVAALEGSAVFLEKVGSHDDTERWGERASLNEYEARLLNAQDLGHQRPRSALSKDREPAALFEQKLTLPQIVERSAEVSDLLIDDVAGALVGYHDGTIEDWMIFLSPLQRRSVERAISGPARISGGPGTGKTVVALHRAAAFAREAGDGKVLVASYVRTVPEVLDGLFERLAPTLRGRVDFLGVHSLAGAVLSQRGIAHRVDDVAARKRFGEAYNADATRRARLQLAGLSEAFVWEEITRVIEGREIDEESAYLGITRYGRHHQMKMDERKLVWALYREYLAACQRGNPPILDWSRQLQLACEVLRDEPPRQLYRAVIVDEAQDITAAGLNLLLTLLEGGPNGQLLLVGDNAQRIYPGGFRLSDLHLDIRGRSFVLQHCYRSTDEIMRAAGALGRFLSTEDFGDDGVRNVSLRTVRAGQRPKLRHFGHVDLERDWLIKELRSPGTDLDACAVLVPTNSLATAWIKRLDEAGLSSCSLLTYSGRPATGVKVGTYNRAKGLEFKRVFLPNLSRYGLSVDPSAADELILRGSQLYVAMTRARDSLDLSYAGDRSLLLDPVEPHVDLS